MEDKINVWKGGRNVYLREADLTVANLSIVFKLRPTDMFLITEGGDVILPGSTGYFTVPLGQRCEVCGDERTSSLHPDSPAPSTSAAATGLRFPPRPGRAASWVLPTPTPPRPPTTYNRSIFIGMVERGQLVVERRMILTLTEQEAQSTGTVCARIKRELGTDQEIQLCDAKGKQLVISSTDSANLWKRGSTQTVVVLLEGEYQELKRAKRRRTSVGGDTQQQIEDLVLAADGLPAVIQHIRQLLDSSTEVLTPVQIATIRDTLKCEICTVAMMNPVMDPACKALIGCRICVQQWVLNDGSCPKCQDPRFGANNFELTGLDDVLNNLRNIAGD